MADPKEFPIEEIEKDTRQWLLEHHYEDSEANVHKVLSMMWIGWQGVLESFVEAIEEELLPVDQDSIMRINAAYLRKFD